MLFNSPIFLFFFLPVVLVVYLFLHKKFKNIALIIFSIFFYLFSSIDFILILLLSIVINFFIAILIFKSKDKKSFFLLIGLLLNLGGLFYYKYLIFFVGHILNPLRFFFNLPALDLPLIVLPLALSFYTFHVLSYLLDVYKEKINPEKNLFKLALYFLFFPHLIAGPIVRFGEILTYLNERIQTLTDFNYGVKRFIFGLTKKVLIADTLAPVVEEIFASPVSHLGFATSWIGIISFTIQIYFDFSGYSDMAIGLGYMFGFKFPENFNYPYVTESIGEFWTRWHMTLGRWFRDYVYIPLGGNKRSFLRNYCNIIFVFFLTGIWHGAGWNFIVWGLLQAFFIVIERFNNGIFIKYLWPPLKHLYALLAIIIGWVVFRSDSISYAVGYLRSMFGLGDFQKIIEYHPFNYYLRNDVILALALGIIFSLPIYPKAISILAKIQEEYKWDRKIALRISGLGVQMIILIILLLFSLMTVASQTYNPFIYFRF